MPDIIKLISELEEILYSSDLDIVACLKKTRIIAKYYNDLEIVQWIENELTGYTDEKGFPEYRRITCSFYRKAYWADRMIGIRGSYDDIIDTTPYANKEPIENIIKNSEENTIDLIFFHDGAQANIKIRGSDLKKIIMEVNLKLSDYIHEKSELVTKIPYETPIMKIFNRFHLAAKIIEERYNERSTIIIKDEYDTQDLLKTLLSIEFESIQDEEYSPSFAGKRSRIDFFLRIENIGIEVKKVRDKSHSKSINEEIIIDKECYSKLPGIENLYFFIYDPEFYLTNRKDLVEDLEKTKPNGYKNLRIIVKPEL
jgi:hypothetical protein